MLRPMFALVLVASSFTPSVAEEYKTAESAKVAGVMKLSTRDYAEAQKPLETALAMTPADDRKERTEIYRMLMRVYRQLPEIDKMQEAVEYIQKNEDSTAGRSLVARDFSSFLFQRGKADWATKHYEETLKTDPRDPTALAVLSNLYGSMRSDKKERADTLKAELKILNRERAATKAKGLEEKADKDPETAASIWKDAAKTWLEADDQARAKAAVEKSRKAAPESRSKILSMFWREGLGDVLVQLGETDQAIKEYEAAIEFTNPGPSRASIEKKLDEVKNPKPGSGKPEAAKPAATTDSKAKTT